jgi:hypothetical protein
MVGGLPTAFVVPRGAHALMGLRLRVGQTPWRRARPRGETPDADSYPQGHNATRQSVPWFCAQVQTPRSDSAQGQDPPRERLT